ncbi:MAG TPA: hypothetical protein VHE30_07665, partial [Polyangiaceae bacterium]|nr:hypothetical protein [Polyangiaceae bacterium]
MAHVKRKSVGERIARYGAAGALAAASSLAFGGCSADSNATKSRVAIGCTLSSDCDSSLVCTFGRCHVACQTSKDCSGGGRCVYTGEDHVCQLEQEAECLHNTDCVAPLACAVDAKCRNQCNGDRDCVTGQKCVSSGVCADPEELGADGNLKVVLAMDPHAPGAGGRPPELDSGTSANAGGGGASSGGTTGSGGASGASGMGGTVGAGGAKPAADPCEPGDGGFAREAAPNDDRQHATHIAIEDATAACIQNGADLDWFEFSAPPTSVQGGFLVVRVSDVAPNASLRVGLSTAADSTEVVSASSASGGGDVTLWIAVSPGVTARAEVAPAYGSDGNSGPYSITAKFLDAVEAGEPNDTRSQATDIAVGSAASGRFFAGHRTSDNPPPADWTDWYRVTLPAGTAVATVGDVAPDTGATVLVTDSTGAPLEAASASATDGADAVSSVTV